MGHVECLQEWREVEQRAANAQQTVMTALRGTGSPTKVQLEELQQLRRLCSSMLRELVNS